MRSFVFGLLVAVEGAAWANGAGESSVPAATQHMESLAGTVRAKLATKPGLMPSVKGVPEKISKTFAEGATRLDAEGAQHNMDVTPSGESRLNVFTEPETVSHTVSPTRVRADVYDRARTSMDTVSVDGEWVSEYRSTSVKRPSGVWGARKELRRDMRPAPGAPLPDGSKASAHAWVVHSTVSASRPVPLRPEVETQREMEYIVDGEKVFRVKTSSTKTR
jgi:hypothetical protein